MKDIRIKSKRFKDMTKPLLGIAAANAAVQTAIIGWQPTPKYIREIAAMPETHVKLQKALSVAEIAVGTTVTFVKILKSEMLRRFKTTGRYTAKSRRR
jgi:hypothetical protein